MIRLLKKTGFCFFLLAVFFPVNELFAQGRTITGTITSSDTKQPVAGATVTVKGTRTATTTDAQGKFKITVANNATTLVVTSASYAITEITIGSDNNVTAEIAPDVKAIDDVVVIGYQSVRRKDLLASVSSVGAKDLKDIPINSAAEALNGRLAGVTATTAEGAPDADVRVRVRGGMSITGDNAPLYVIDGVVVESGLTTLSPQDIQSIDVLKDAAATAIYGARGANGVIVITTKGGRAGKPLVSYNGFVGTKVLAKRLDVLSPYDYVIYQYERSRGSNQDSTSFARNFGTTWDTLNVYKNMDDVDWQEETFGRTGITTTHNISVTGGNKNLTYIAGYTYNNEKAIVINSNYKRHLFNGKVDYKITKNLKVGVTGRLIHLDVYGAGVSDAKGSSYNRLRNAVKYRPFLSAGQDLEDPDPLADPNVGNGLNLYNPVEMANQEYRKKTTDAYNITAYLSYQITRNLSFKSTAGYDVNKLIDLNFNDSVTPYAVIQGGRKPIAGMDTTERKLFTNSNVLTYQVNNWKGKHDFTALVGEETWEQRTESHSSLFRNYPLNTTPESAFKETGQGTPFTGYPKYGETRATLLSFFGRINYAYKDKYLFSFNMRADGSSKFAPGKKWGYFPAGSFAWRVKNEKFLKNSTAISDLKVRVSYGEVGNNRINDYLYITSFSNDGRYYYGLNNSAIIAYYPSFLTNLELQWEATVNRNLGVDVGFFRNRVSLSVDVYNNTSDHLLLSAPIPGTFGYTQQQQNIGKTRNQGVEIQLNADIMRKSNGFNWTMNFNVAFNKNKILQLGKDQFSFQPAAAWGVSGQPADYIEMIGKPVGSIWGWVTAGMYTVDDFDYNYSTGQYTLKAGVPSNTTLIGTVLPGSIKFSDINKDGVVNNDDRTIIGDPTPKCTGGLNQQFTYRRWDMSLFVNFSLGNDIYNANKIEFTNGYTNNANMLAINENRFRTINAAGQTMLSQAGVGWAPQYLAEYNKNATIWQPLRGAGAFFPHSWAIEDGSFLRLNNLTIGYSVPIKSLAGIKMSKLRFYFTGNNLATITNYSGYDPEVSVRSNPLTPALDYSAYPKSRSFIFGVNATF